MDRLRDQLFAGSRFAAHQHGRVGARHLRHLLVHEPHRTAGAQNVRKVVALAQLELQMGVFLPQPVALIVDDALNANRLGHQRRDDAQKFHAAIEIAIGFEAEIGAEGADCLAVQQNRHADVADFLARQFGTFRRAPQKHRLARDPRHDDRLAALRPRAR